MKCGRIPTFQGSTLPEDRGSMNLWNVGILPQHYTFNNLVRTSQKRQPIPVTKISPVFTSHWRQHGPPKRRYPTTNLHGVTTQKTSTWNNTAV